MRENLDLEWRFAPPAEDGTIEGVAMRFNVLDTYGTTFDHRAFASIKKRVPMLWSHRADELIGSWFNFTLSDTELRAFGKLNLEVQRAREIRAMLLAGDVQGFSVGFSTLKDERRANGVRHITQAILHEISLVAIPSVPGTGVTSVRFGGASAAADFIAAVKSARRALS
mgnify:CR=1 FL=1